MNKCKLCNWPIEENDFDDWPGYCSEKCEAQDKLITMVDCHE